MRSSFLSGDSLAQFYPWSKCYSEAIKGLSFPFWVSAMGSGFPLMAEGQVGGFYPLNILMFFVLPFNAAYNLSIIAHFAIAGIFTYLFTRKLGADGPGAYVGAMLFCFGSAYAGCFYNIISLRTLAWFPLVLLLFEGYMESRKMRFIAFSAVVLGMQFLAGFLQMAVYSALFYAVYLIYRACFEKLDPVSIFKILLVLVAISCVIAFPQLALTYKLATYSAREHATLGFALWRSFLPYGLLGTVFPYSFSSIGANFYVSLLGLLFAVYAFFKLKHNGGLRAIVLIFFLAIFFAIGWLNPVYVGFLEVTKWYFFRNPSKFLFFASFSLSVLSAVGFTALFHDRNSAIRRKAISIFSAITLFVGASFIGVKVVLIFFGENLRNLGYYIAKSFVYAKPHHRHPLDYYIETVNSFYEKLVGSFSLSDKYVLASWAIVLVSLSVAMLARKRNIRYLCVVLMFADLFVFSFYGIGFRGDIKPYGTLAPCLPRIFGMLKSDKERYRILPFGIRTGKLPNWCVPNTNMIYGLDNVGCYTPLVFRDYRSRLLDLEAVDDSLGLNIPAEGSIEKNIGLLRMLNVKYVISYRRLPDVGIEKLAEEDGIFLYEINGYLPRAFFTYSIDGVLRPERAVILDIAEYKGGSLKLSFSSDKKGFIVFSENWYPGWKAYVDGCERPLIRVRGMIQGVAVNEGEHDVNFLYEPYIGSPNG
jgi:hypothetical protein